MPIKLLLSFSYYYRFLLEFERFVGVEEKKTSLNAARAGVKSKRRRQILNGNNSVLKKRKVAKSEQSSCQGLNSAISADDQDAVVDNKLSSDFVSDECKNSSADEDLRTDVHQSDAAAQPTASVRYCFLHTLVDKLAGDSCVRLHE